MIRHFTKDKEQDIKAAPHAVERQSSSARPRRKWQGPLFALAVVLLAAAAWQFHATQDYWAAMWRERTIFPSTGGTVLFPAQFTQFRGPQAGPGFDLSRTTIPRNQIISGGVRKDGIPALTDPEMIDADKADFMRPDERVIGIEVGDRARAYPIKILNYHEVVNDRGGDVPLAVTYCPLCDSAAVFDRRTDNGVIELGVSGLLFNSNVLMHDRGSKPESLWSQMRGEGVSGPGAQQPLKALPFELTTWADWLDRHPDTEVLSDQTGHRRNYSANPYRGYFARPALMFPVRPINRRLPATTRVLGISAGGQSRAYPLTAFGHRDETLQQKLGGKNFTIHYNADAKSLRVVSADAGIQWTYAFWFAWYAFHPQTEIFQRGR